MWEVSKTVLAYCINTDTQSWTLKPRLHRYIRRSPEYFAAALPQSVVCGRIAAITRCKLIPDNAVGAKIAELYARRIVWIADRLRFLHRTKTGTVQTASSTLLVVMPLFTLRRRFCRWAMDFIAIYDAILQVMILRYIGTRLVSQHQIVCIFYAQGVVLTELEHYTPIQIPSKICGLEDKVKGHHCWPWVCG